MSDNLRLAERMHDIPVEVNDLDDALADVRARTRRRHRSRTRRAAVGAIVGCGLVVALIWGVAHDGSRGAVVAVTGTHDSGASRSSSTDTTDSTLAPNPSVDGAPASTSAPGLGSGTGPAPGPTTGSPDIVPPGPTVTRPPTLPTDFNACNLLTRAELGAALGYEVDAATAGHLGGWPSCTYTSVAHSSDMAGLLTVSADRSGFDAHAAKYHLTPVSGVGEAAATRAGEIIVLGANVWFTIDVETTSGADLTALAQIVLGRVP